MSAYLVGQSLARALSRQASYGMGGPCCVMSWCARRWLAQTSELALWTFYYLRLSQDIPWRPFPEFVNVWYQSRIGVVSKWPKRGWPMWLLSSLFVYEPVNRLFGWHSQRLS